MVSDHHFCGWMFGRDLLQAQPELAVGQAPTVLPHWEILQPENALNRDQRIEEAFQRVLAPGSLALSHDDARDKGLSETGQAPFRFPLQRYMGHVVGKHIAVDAFHSTLLEITEK